MPMHLEEYKQRLRGAPAQRHEPDEQNPQPEKPTTKKREFSKLILVGVSAVNIVIVVFTLVVVWRTSDTSPLAYLIPAGAAEMAAATGFYYNKAKAENKIKLMVAAKKLGLQTEDIYRFDEDQEV